MHTAGDLSSNAKAQMSNEIQMPTVKILKRKVFSKMGDGVEPEALFVIYLPVFSLIRYSLPMRCSYSDSCILDSEFFISLILFKSDAYKSFLIFS